MITHKEYARRRAKIIKKMGAGAIAVLPAAPHKTRNRDSEYAYRQDSDFLYLTGFSEPEAVLVLIPGRKEGEFVLFCRERDPQMETWNGPRAGLEGARTQYGAAESHSIADLDKYLPALMENRTRVYAVMGHDADFDRRLHGWLHEVRRKARLGVRAPREFHALDHLVHELRLYKSAGEIALMRHAAHVSASAHRRAMQVCRPGMKEYQIEGELWHEFMSHGCRHGAYNPIVGGGANACILHYTANDALLHDGDMLLIDAGAEHAGYAADITRTFPVNGRFTPAQRALYEVVLEAQLAAIEHIRPGKHWQEPHEAAVRVLTEGLVALGLLKGKPKKLIERGEYRRYYMHRTGHWLGLDVHDVGEYKQSNEAWRVFEPGMVLTVEPGLYVTAQAPCARKWRNIGIRIEDDVLVTADGADILSHAAPKTIADIEALMQS